MTRKRKAVALISGGLDSALAAKMIQDCGISVEGVYFEFPWSCGNQIRAKDIAKQLNIPLKIITFDEEYLKIVRHAKHGYGAAFNPCMDCHAYMLKNAKELMNQRQADFIVTGEVLGQRPMSQLKHSLNIVEKDSKLKGYLLRPLCAQLLEETIPEKEGWVERAKLGAISGRSRKDQIALAKKYKIKNYLQPAGGCLLTDKNFANRLKDTFRYGYRDMDDIAILRFGRHFRYMKEHKIIVGRDKNENEMLIRYAHGEDILFEFKDKLGPTAVYQSKHPSKTALQLSADLVKFFSKAKDRKEKDVLFWKKSHPHRKECLAAHRITSEKAGRYKL